MNNDMKLTKIYDNFPSSKERLKKITKEVKEHKKKITNLADEYNSKYKREIEEGTKKKQLLLQEGKRQGLSDREAEQYATRSSGFIPTVHTPVLNWLFFFMNEHKNPQKEQERTQLNEQVGHMTHREVNVMENTPELFTYLYGNITLDVFSKLKKLKALSRSSNENEAFRAYRKCLALCEEHKVDFDKIPTVLD